MSDHSEPYEYILYIDEAGDDGLKAVRPFDPIGGTEWLCIGAVLVRVSNEQRVVEWVKTIRHDIDAKQGPVLHYRNLSPTKKRRVCELLAEQELVCFAVCSNKKNMRQHQNDRAAARGGKQWFYNFCVRLLMERVTELCLKDSNKRYKETRNLKVIFSERGGHSYGQTKAYWELLKRQSIAGTTFLPKRVMRHEVLRYGLVDYVPHNQNAGLQLADVVASAFFQACDVLENRWNPEPAKLLAPRLYREAGVVADNGLILQPIPPKRAALTDEQKVIFRHFGYTF
jgi:hypothetical protein